MANQHKYDVQITFKIVRQGQGLKEVQDELKKTENISRNANKNMWGQWTELRSKILLAKFALQEVSQAIRAIMMTYNLVNNHKWYKVKNSAA